MNFKAVYPIFRDALLLLLMCVKRVQEPGTPPLPSTLFKKPFQAVQQSIISFLFIVRGNIAIIFKLELLNSSFGLWKEL